MVVSWLRLPSSAESYQIARSAQPPDAAPYSRGTVPAPGHLVAAVAGPSHSEGSMRVTFFRVPDHQRGHALVERDDGVVYQLDGGPFTAALPHDLVHFTVEEALGMGDGIWAAIAGGAVLGSMKHKGGRRPPHAAERSAALLRAHRDRLQRAELLAGIAQRVAHGPSLSPGAIAGILREWFYSLPDPGVGPAEIGVAVQALRRAEQRWRALPVGGTICFDWPASRRLAAPPSRRQLPRTRRVHRGG
jgi:hypothetical protein